MFSFFGPSPPWHLTQNLAAVRWLEATACTNRGTATNGEQKKGRFCFQFPLSSFDNDGETMKFAAAATWQKQINNSMRRHLQTVSKTGVVNKQMTERGKNSLLLITCFPCNCDLIGPPCCVFTLRHTGLHCGVCLQAIHSWHPDNLLRYAHTFISPKHKHSLFVLKCVAQPTSVYAF